MVNFCMKLSVQVIKNGKFNVNLEFVEKRLPRKTTGILDFVLYFEIAGFCAISTRKEKKTCFLYGFLNAFKYHEDSFIFQLL